MTSFSQLTKKIEKVRANDMKRVAADAHLLNPRLFEPAKRADDRVDLTLMDQGEVG